MIITVFADVTEGRVQGVTRAQSRDRMLAVNPQDEQVTGKFEYKAKERFLEGLEDSCCVEGAAPSWASPLASRRRTPS